VVVISPTGFSSKLVSVVIRETRASQIRTTRRDGSEDNAYLFANANHVAALAERPADGVQRPDDSQERRSTHEGSTKAAAETTSGAQAVPKHVVEHVAERETCKDLPSNEQRKSVNIAVVGV